MMMPYIGLAIAFVGGTMGLVTNINQPEFDTMQGIISVSLIVASVVGFVWLRKRS